MMQRTMALIALVAALAGCGGDGREAQGAIADATTTAETSTSATPTTTTTTEAPTTSTTTTTVPPTTTTSALIDLVPIEERDQLAAALFDGLNDPEWATLDSNAAGLAGLAMCLRMTDANTFEEALAGPVTDSEVLDGARAMMGALGSLYCPEHVDRLGLTTRDYAVFGSSDMSFVAAFLDGASAAQGLDSPLHPATAALIAYEWCDIMSEADTWDAALPGVSGGGPTDIPATSEEFARLAGYVGTIYCPADAVRLGLPSGAG